MEIERLLRIREAILLFFHLHEQHSTPESFRSWLRTLPASRRKQVEKLGYHRGKQLISFQSYLLEQKGYLISDFLEDNLSQEDFEYFLLIGSPLSSAEPLPC